MGRSVTTALVSLPLKDLFYAKDMQVLPEKVCELVHLYNKQERCILKQVHSSPKLPPNFPYRPYTHLPPTPNANAEPEKSYQQLSNQIWWSAWCSIFVERSIAHDVCGQCIWHRFFHCSGCLCKRATLPFDWHPNAVGRYGLKSYVIPNTRNTQSYKGTQAKRQEPHWATKVLKLQASFSTAHQM